jgi:hypothetical protein
MKEEDHIRRARERAREYGPRNGQAGAATDERYPLSEYDDTPPQQEYPGDHALLPILTCGELLAKYTERRPAVIEGLLRVGETMNIIAPSKIGKSWLSLGLAFAIATGQAWLSTFATSPGNVLLIDNELHPETSAHRLRTLARALCLPENDIAEAICTVNLRGRLENLVGMGAGLRRIERGRFKLVIIDAFYRTLPLGTDENDNAAMALLYNQLDAYADSLGAAISLIHHASKGNQSGKAVTDVGSGAGAQARATDTHLILRTHEEDNAVVLDAAVRSWPPVSPLCLRWAFPCWMPAQDLDPMALRLDRPRRRPEKDESRKPPDAPWTAKRLADTFGRAEPRPRAALIDDAMLNGLSERKATQLLRAAIDCEYLHASKERGANSRTMISTVKPS